MTRVIQPGFFTMDFVNEIASKSNLAIAKSMCYDKIDEQPNAFPENIMKARNMVMQANSIRQLVIGLGNFVLAHESPKLKVIR